MSHQGSSSKRGRDDEGNGGSTINSSSGNAKKLTIAPPPWMSALLEAQQRRNQPTDASPRQQSMAVPAGATPAATRSLTTPMSADFAQPGSLLSRASALHRSFQMQKDATPVDPTKSTEAAPTAVPRKTKPVPNQQPRPNLQASVPSAPTTTNHQPTVPKPKPPSRTVVAVTAAPGADTAEALLERFKTPSDDSGHLSVADCQRVVTAEDMTQVVDAVHQSAIDEETVVAPLLGVVPVFQSRDSVEGVTSCISLCSSGRGKYTLCPGDPFSFSATLSKVIVVWNKKGFIFDAPLGLQFVHTCLKELPAQVDLVTFDAPTLLVPLIIKYPNLHFCRRMGDVRLAAWMVSPQDTCTDFDAIHLSYLKGSRCSPHGLQTLEGTLERAALLVPLYRRLTGVLGAKSMLRSYLTTERHMLLVTSHLKVNGFSVDAARVASYSDEAKEEMSNIRSQAAVYAAGVMPTFNLQSPDDCRKLIYDHLNLHKHLPLPYDSRTNTGKLSTNEETMRMLMPYHPLPGLVIAFRKVAKTSQSYLEGLFAANCGKTGKCSVYPNFNLESTDTGRLSCVEPNMQNLPRPNEQLAGCVRKAFVAPPGELIIAVDYEQIELRVLAHMSGDRALIKAFQAAPPSLEDEPHSTSTAAPDAGGGCDIHRRIAAVMFRKPESCVSPDERTRAKRVVFGTLYGMGPKALAAQINEAFDVALKIQQQFKASFPQVEHYRRQVVEECQRDSSHAVRTLNGRSRYLPDIVAADQSRRAAAERQAFNTVIQGSAADIIKKAMCDLAEAQEKAFSSEQPSPLRSLVVRGQVHDELIATVPAALASTAAAEVTRIMCSSTQLVVPLMGKASVGPSLGELVDVDVTTTFAK